MTLAARRRATAALMLAPSLAVFGVFFLWPILSVAWLSLHRWDLLATPRFVGLDNYGALLAGRELWPVLGRTLAYSAGTVLGAVSLGLALALALHRTGRIGRPLRAAIFSSYVVSWVGVSLLWTYLLDGQLGPVTAALEALGLPAPDWLGDPDTALGALVLVSIWKVVGYDMVIYLAALEDIPREVLEAARLDGAGPWARLSTIVWPLLRPTTRFLVVTGLLMTFQGFDVVRVMTAGGPASATQIFVHWVYEQAFTYFRMGPAAAAVVLVLIPLATLPWVLGRGDGQGPR